MSFLSNERLILRAISLGDATPTYLSWINDKETTKGLETGKYPSTMESLVGYIKAMQADKGTVMFAMIERETEKHIGNIKIHNFDWVARTCELGLMIGDKDTRGKGYGYEACSLVIEYAFERLNVRKVWLAVYDNNPAAFHIYRKLGFEEEGRLRKHIFSNGEYYDKIYMGVFHEEFLGRTQAN